MDFERGGRDPFEVVSRNFLGGTEEYEEILSADIRFSGQDSNLTSSEYES
jgi:hypothetical protein